MKSQKYKALKVFTCLILAAAFGFGSMPTNTGYAAEISEVARTVTTVSEFDVNGRVLRETRTEGERTAVTVFTYRPNGTMQRQVMTSSDEQEGQTIEFDEQGRITKISGFDLRWNHRFMSRSEYNEQGFLARQTDYDEDENVTGWSLFEYDEQGRQILSATHNADGIVVARTITEFGEEFISQKTTTYDARGNVELGFRWEFTPDFSHTLRTVNYNANGEIEFWQTFERDENGRVPEIVTFNANGSVREREIIEFNELGQTVRRTFQNAAGVVRGIVEMDPVSQRPIRETWHHEWGETAVTTFEYNADGSIATTTTTHTRRR